MTVRTTTTIAQQHLVRIVRAPTLDSRLSDLLAILKRGARETDRTSIALSNWGNEIITLILNGTDLEVLASRIDELRRTILVNPLDRSSLREPMMANGEIYERWMLDHIRSLDSISPFDLEPFTSFTPHVFAQEMIHWIDALLSSTEDHDLNALTQKVLSLEEEWDKKGYLNREEALAERPIRAAMHYCHFALAFLQERENEEEIHLYRSTVRVLDAVIQSATESVTVNLRALKESLEENHRNHEETVHTLQQIHHEIRSALENQLTLARDDLTRLRGDLDHEMMRASELENRLHSVETELRSCKQELGHIRQSLNDDRDGGCTIT